MSAVSDAVPDFLPVQYLIKTQPIVDLKIQKERRERCGTGLSTCPFSICKSANDRVANTKGKHSSTEEVMTKSDAKQWKTQQNVTISSKGYRKAYCL